MPVLEGYTVVPPLVHDGDFLFYMNYDGKYFYGYEGAVPWKYNLTDRVMSESTVEIVDNSWRTAIRPLDFNTWSQLNLQGYWIYTDVEVYRMYWPDTQNILEWRYVPEPSTDVLLFGALVGVMFYMNMKRIWKWTSKHRGNTCKSSTKTRT